MYNINGDIKTKMTDMGDDRYKDLDEKSCEEIPDIPIIPKLHDSGVSGTCSTLPSIPLWLWNKDKKEFFGFTAMNWIRVFLIFIIGIGIGANIKYSYVAGSVTNQCNKYILENYRGYEDYNDAINGEFVGISPLDALDQGLELDYYNIPILERNSSYPNVNSDLNAS